MARKPPPLALHIPASWLRYHTALVDLLAAHISIPTSLRAAYFHLYEFRNDEKQFALEVLRRKPNLWLWRCNQQQFCGDFILVDMSSPLIAHRKVYLLDLKAGAPLKLGGGGAGIQFRNASLATEEIAKHHAIIPNDHPIALLSGDRVHILAYIGISSESHTRQHIGAFAPTP